MALPYATQQIIRVVTDKVLEQVSKQMSQRQSAPQIVEAPQADLPSGNPDLMMILERFNAAIIKLQTDVEERDLRILKLEKRLSRLEKKWGWSAVLKIGLVSFLTCAGGIALGALLRLGGWFG